MPHNRKRKAPAEHARVRDAKRLAATVESLLIDAIVGSDFRKNGKPLEVPFPVPIQDTLATLVAIAASSPP